MRTSEVVALLDLLTGRGTVAWQVAGPTEPGARLVLDVSGVDSAAGLLVSRGFTAVEIDLPRRLVLAHPRHGRVVLLPCAFTTEGDARWLGPDGEVVVPASAFDDVHTVPRTVSFDPEAPAD